MRLYPNYATFFDSLAPGTMVLTPNQRLSRFVVRQYDLWRQQQERTSWEPISASSFNLWIQKLYQQLAMDPALTISPKQVLMPFQDELIWQSAATLSMEESELLSADSVAKLAARGWRSLGDWCIAVDEVSEDSDAAILFRSCVKRYQSLCEELQVVDFNGVVDIVLKHLRCGEICLPEQCVFLGYELFSPRESALLQTLTERGVDVLHKNLYRDGDVVRIGLKDNQDEIESAARWSAQILSEHPQTSIAIVIPELARMRTRVERVFVDVFEPQSVLPTSERHAFPFNISAAQPLVQSPLIAAAFDALQLNNRTLDAALAGRLLRSPFIGVEEDRNDRNLIENELMESVAELTLSEFIAIVGSIATGKPEVARIDFHDRLLSFVRAITSLQQRNASYAFWAEHFTRQLQILGWPGDRRLDTLEYQQLSQWNELLRELATLDTIAPVCTLGQALQRLKRMAYRPFQPQTADSPIQILGLLEAAGVQFDYLWVAGMNDDLWPEPCEPNPLLPTQLQKKHHMPRASWERELTLARMLTERFSRSADLTVFSYAQSNGDQPLRPSALIGEMNPITLHDLVLYEPINYKITASVTPEALEDYWGGPLLLTDKPVKGGTQIIKDQAACPFRAFARHRLNATLPNTMEEGVSAMRRGVLLHRALELIWDKLPDQIALNALDEPQLRQLLETSLQKAWTSLAPAKTLEGKFKEIEFNRSRKILSDWMTVESQRSPFIVIAHEKQKHLQLGPLTLTLRFDRIDQHIESEGSVVIDYKTGETSLGNWMGSRPDEPQVPLYALALKRSIKAVAFGQLATTGVALKGLADEREAFPEFLSLEQLDKKLQMPAEWQQLIGYWEIVAVSLASDFAHGRAVVDPKKGAATCRFCGLQSLCRISAQREVVDNG